jgi:hypothetical protein
MYDDVSIESLELHDAARQKLESTAIRKLSDDVGYENMFGLS